MKKYLLLFLSLFAMQFSQAQDSRRMNYPLGGQVQPSTVTEDFQPVLQRFKAPSPGGEGYRSYLQSIKEQLPDLRGIESQGSAKTFGGATNPTLATNFNGNNYINGVPNDNDMAISNGGKIVSVINSNIFFFDSSGASLGNISLDTWSASLGLTASKYDPRALYDPVYDRFIIVCLNGFVDSTSAIVVGFSESNDPTGNWNLYALPGDPNLDTLWTDYPILGLTENELFITGNLLRNNESWQLGFAESICWQIDLDNPYQGDSLETRLWYNIGFGGASIRNLCPIQGGSGPAGPNLYLLSNRNFAVNNDTVFIMEITDTMNAPSVQYLVDYGLTNLDYGMPPNARQQFNQFLATNDARWLDGFIENGNVQFVGNTYAPTTGYCGIYHGTVTDIAGTRTVTGEILADSLADYGYPGIAWCDVDPNGDDAMILGNFSGPTIKASYGVVYYDAPGNYSELIPARAGQSYINVLTGLDRWGDYSGIQTKYNMVGVVWTAATWGRFNHQGGTWIANYGHPLIIANESPQPKTQVETFPNPTVDFVSVVFDLEHAVFGEIILLDVNGKLVKSFLSDRLRSGHNKFSFSTEPLAAGTYLLQVKSNGEILATKKVVKI